MVDFFLEVGYQWSASLPVPGAVRVAASAAYGEGMRSSATLCSGITMTGLGRLQSRGGSASLQFHEHGYCLEWQRRVSVQQQCPLAFHFAVLKAIPPGQEEKLFSVSVGLISFSVRSCYSSQKELINTQIALSFAEFFDGKSNAFVKTVVCQSHA